jgi:hypothetical protein
MRPFATGRKRAQARRRWITVGLVLATAAVTAVSAAQLVAGPDDRGELDRAITKQKVEAGELASNEAKAKEESIEHQDKPYTVDQMRELAKGYEAEMRTSIDRAETARIVAYRSKDIIRMTCIEDKLLQMRTVISIAEPRFLTIQATLSDDLEMRGQFSIIHQAWERVRALVTEIEVCSGEALNSMSGGPIEEGTRVGGDVDPTRPETPYFGLDRPPEASTYR